MPVVAAALLALAAAESKDRVAVARLLRSGYVDAPRALGAEMTFRDAERVLERIARALETKATAAGADPTARASVATAGGDEHADAIAALVLTLDGPDTCPARAARCGSCFLDLGIAARAWSRRARDLRPG